MLTTLCGYCVIGLSLVMLHTLTRQLFQRLTTLCGYWIIGLSLVMLHTLTRLTFLAFNNSLQLLHYWTQSRDATHSYKVAFSAFNNSLWLLRYQTQSCDAAYSHKIDFSAFNTNKNSINNTKMAECYSKFALKFALRSNYSTPNHQFFYLSSNRLRHQRFVIRLEDGICLVPKRFFNYYLFCFNQGGCYNTENGKFFKISSRKNFSLNQIICFMEFSSFSQEISRFCRLNIPPWE